MHGHVNIKHRINFYQVLKFGIPVKQPFLSPAKCQICGGRRSLPLLPTSQKCFLFLKRWNIRSKLLYIITNFQKSPSNKITFVLYPAELIFDISYYFLRRYEIRFRAVSYD
jgi:hypothetical protein